MTYEPFLITFVMAVSSRDWKLYRIFFDADSCSLRTFFQLVSEHSDPSFSIPRMRPEFEAVFAETKKTKQEDRGELMTFG